MLSKSLFNGLTWKHASNKQYFISSARLRGRSHSSNFEEALKLLAEKKYGSPDVAKLEGVILQTSGPKTSGTTVSVVSNQWHLCATAQVQRWNDPVPCCSFQHV